MIYLSNSPSDRPRAQMRRPQGMALALVVAIALVLVLVGASCGRDPSGWPGGDAFDPYSRLNAIEPFALSAKSGRLLLAGLLTPIVRPGLPAPARA